MSVPLAVSGWVTLAVIHAELEQVATSEII